MHEIELVGDVAIHVEEAKKVEVGKDVQYVDEAEEQPWIWRSSRVDVDTVKIRYDLPCDWMTRREGEGREEG